MNRPEPITSKIIPIRIAVKSGPNAAHRKGALAISVSEATTGSANPQIMTFGGAARNAHMLIPQKAINNPSSIRPCGSGPQCIQTERIEPSASVNVVGPIHIFNLKATAKTVGTAPRQANHNGMDARIALGIFWFSLALCCVDGNLME